VREESGGRGEGGEEGGGMAKSLEGLACAEGRDLRNEAVAELRPLLVVSALGVLLARTAGAVARHVVLLFRA
jgi:hypothetical protein